MNLFDEQAFRKTWVNIFSTLGVDNYKNELSSSTGIYGVNKPVPIIFFNSKQYNKGISGGNRILSKTPNGKIIFPGKDMTNLVVPGILYRDLRLIHYDHYTVTAGKDIRTKEYWLYLLKDLKIKAIKIYRSLYLKYNPDLGLREAKNIVDKDKAVITINSQSYLQGYINFLEKGIITKDINDPLGINDPFFVPDTQMAPKARNNLRNSFKAKGTLTYNDIVMNVVSNTPPTIKDIFVDIKKDFNTPKIVSESTGVDILERIETLETILRNKEKWIINLEITNLDKQKSIHKLEEDIIFLKNKNSYDEKNNNKLRENMDSLDREIQLQNNELITLYNDLEDLINKQQTQNPVPEQEDNKEINVWNIIGCNPKDNKDFILAETYKAIKSYHPDKVNNAGFLIKEYANEILKNLLSFKKRIS